jgi:hypothetical protein
MKIPQNKWQSPFQEKMLLSKQNFKKFCCEQGLQISVKDLEYLYQEKILIPVLRVRSGYSSFKKIYITPKWHFVSPEDINSFSPEKIAKENYYHTAGIFYRKGWLIENYKAGFLSFPSQWGIIDFGSYTPGFVTEIEKIKNDSEIYYSKNQFIVLKLIYQDVDFARNASAKWKDLFLEKSRKIAQEFNKILYLYEDIEILFKEKEEDSKSAYEKFYEENNKHKADAEKDRNAYEKKEQREKFGLKSKNLLKKHKLSSDDFENWIWRMAQKSFL